MHWFRNQRTATKLIFSFGFLAALMGVLGLLGYRAMAKIQDSLRDLHQNHALGVMHLEEANTHLTATGRSIRRLQVAADPAQVETATQDLMNHRRGFEQSFEQFRKTLATDAGRAKAAEAENIWKEMCSKQDSFVDALHHNQRQQAMGALPILVSAAAQADLVVNELSGMKQTLMQKAADQAEDEFKSAQRGMLTIVLVAIALAAGMGWTIARMIAQPLGEAVSTLQAISEGDFTKELKVDTTDEIGQMAASLNQAIQSIREALST